MTALSAGLIGASALSGFLGGNKKPGLDNSVYEERAGAQGQSNRLLDSFYGSNYRAGEPGAWAADWEAVKHGNAGPTGAFRYGSPNGVGGPGSFSASSLYGGTTPFGNKPILQQIQEAAQQGISMDQLYMGDFDRESQGINREAQKYGTGREAVIRGDADRALKDAQAQILARSAGSGLGGSTVEAGSLSGAASDNFRERERALTDQAEKATGFKVQTRQRQQGARAALYDSFSGRGNALRMAAPNAQLSVLQSPVANPWSGVTGSPIAQGPSPLQQGLQSGINTFGLLGGQHLASNLYGNGGLPGAADNARRNGNSVSFYPN